MTKKIKKAVEKANVQKKQTDYFLMLRISQAHRIYGI